MSERDNVNIFIASSGELNSERQEAARVILDLNKTYNYLYLEPQDYILDTSSGNNPGHNRIQEK